MQHPTLQSQPRVSFGKKNNALRRLGLLPIKVTGVSKGEHHLSVTTVELVNLIRRNGKSSVIDLIEDQKKIPVMIGHLQRHPVTQQLLHAEFHKVNLKQKTQTDVEIHITGESPIVRTGEGVLLHMVDLVKVEALPDDIPAKIEIDISNLDMVGSEVKISDLPKSDKYHYLDEEDKVLLRVNAHRQQSIEVESETPETEVIGEGETPVEGGQEEVEGEASAETTPDKEE